MISIIIPVKNQWHYTEQILKEIPKKVKSKYEVIVIDDNSTDETNEKMEEYFEEQKKKMIEDMIGYRYYRHAENIGVNKAWNIGVADAKGEYVWIINNDLVLTEGLDKELIEGLKTNKIACPYSTIGNDKFKLPIKKKENNIAGWCFMMKKKDWVPIDERLDIWYGDTWQYLSHNKDVFWGGIVHHFESKSLNAPEIKAQILKRIHKDSYAWEVIKDEKGWVSTR